MLYVNHHTRGQFKGIKIGTNYKNPVLKIEDMSKVTHYGVELNLEQVEVCRECVEVNCIYTRHSLQTGSQINSVDLTYIKSILIALIVPV